MYMCMYMMWVYECMYVVFMDVYAHAYVCVCVCVCVRTYMYMYEIISLAPMVREGYLSYPSVKNNHEYLGLVHSLKQLVEASEI